MSQTCLKFNSEKIFFTQKSKFGQKRNFFQNKINGKTLCESNFRMLEQARTEIDEIGVKITKTRENFNDLMKTYMLKPKKPNQQPEPKDFFDKWTSFSSEFKGK